MLNQRQTITLTSNMVQNPNNDGYCLSITTRSSLSTMDPLLPTVEMPKNQSVMVDETTIVEANRVIGDDPNIGKGTGKEKVDEPKVRQIS